MIQFNLLPDVKLEYVRARSRRRLIIGTSIIVSAVFFCLFLLLLIFVKVNQTKYIGDLTKDINSNVKKLQSKKDLDKVLTIQNQLATLPKLHEQKVISSRLTDYLKQLLPSQAFITSITVDFNANTIQIQGKADSLTTLNKFVDTLKFTEIKSDSSDGASKKAFSNVVLETFSVQKPIPGKPNELSFNLKFAYDPIIFQNQKTDDKGVVQNPVTLSVPNIISTRSETEKPSDLFTTQEPVNTGR